MSTFKDVNGTEWILDIKFRHVEEIKRYCKGKDGKPIDLLSILERGNLEQLVNDIELMVNVVFVICYNQVRERFNLALYDEANRETYEMCPELKTESEKIKASRWFGEQLNGQSLIEMVDAFQEALVNFFPNESRKAALKKILEKSRELERMQSNEMVQQIDEAVAQAAPKIRAETKRRIQESISGALSGNVPESSESIPPPSASGS
jgi:hypothetical protein